MARTAGDAALDFEMKMLLETKEAEANAARLEKSLTGVLNVFEGIGKAATRAMSMIAMAVKAPADLDNYLGSLNTKITTMNGELFKYRDIMIQMERKQRKPGDLMFWFSPEDFQKVQMNFARGAAEAEKYGKEAGTYQEQFGQGVGGLVKLIGMQTETATQQVTSFHRELGITYKEMGEFSKQLGALNKMSGLTADQNQKLYRSITSIGRAYGLSGDKAKRFVLDSTAVGAAISKIGLDAEETLRKMNSVATGSEKGLIQSLLLGFKPGDPISQLQAFQDQAKMITQIAANAGEQFAPFLTRQLGDALGMGDFSVEEIQALAKGQSIEKGDKTELVDVVDVLKEILKTMEGAGFAGPDAASENPYVTAGQTLQQGITQFVGWSQQVFQPAFEQLKNKLGEWLPKMDQFLNKISSFFGGDVSLGELGIAAGALALAPMLLKLVVRTVASFISTKLVGSMVSFLGGFSIGTYIRNFQKEIGVDKLIYAIMDVPVRIIDGIIGFITTLWDTQSITKAVKEMWERFDIKSTFEQLVDGVGQLIGAIFNGIKNLGKNILALGKAAIFGKEGDFTRALDDVFKRSFIDPYVNAYAPTKKELGGYVDAGKALVASHSVPTPFSEVPEKVANAFGGTTKEMQGPFVPSRGQPTDHAMMMQASKIGEELGLRRTDKVGSTHVPGSAHYEGLAQDYSVQGLNEAQIKAAVAKFNATGMYYAKYETDKDGKIRAKLSEKDKNQWAPHIHLQAAHHIRQKLKPEIDALRAMQGKSTGSEEETKEVTDTTTHGLLSKVVSVLEQVQTTLTNNPTAPVQQTASLSNTIQGGTGYEWTQMNNAALVASPAR